MQGRLAKMFTGLVGLAGCAASDPGTGLAGIGTETQSPPAAERQAIEAAVAQWARGRFTPGSPRWFVLKPGTPAVAVMKSIDNSLGKAATRIVETGPDGTGANLYGWQLKKPAGDRDGYVAAISRTDPALAAYYPVKLSPGWPR